MKIKHYIIAFFTALLCSQNASAQQKFNEVSYSPSETTFRLIAPNKPTLRLYDAGTGGKAYKKIKMEQSGENTWTTTVKGNLKGKFYTFDIGHGETPGVFAKAVGCNGIR
ncbi:MAG: type I pullulanase, partial [Prevotella histicola]|nr:type I pullulanase [Prevotella histicola]